MAENHERSLKDRMVEFEEQSLEIQDFHAFGPVLDLGGGGEGVIGVLKGDRVIAIDPNRRELEDAPEGPLKIVMDARDLQFLDATFDTVTAFFTLMYVKGEDHKIVFREVHRVLRPGGRFLIWDVLIPERSDETKDIAVFPFRFVLPREEIKTGYGIRWPEGDRDLSHFTELAETTGFETKEARTEGRTVFLDLKKPE